MTEHPSFGVLLARLSRHRGLDIAGLSRAAQVPEPELKAVLDGAVPSPSLLQQIATAFSLHTADILVIAGLPVPDDLAPLDMKASSEVDKVVRYAIGLHAEQRRQLREYVHSLPQRDRSQHVQMLPVYEQYEPSFGAMIARMLRNRNLDWSSSAKVLFRLTGIGPLSASTVGAIGHGRKELSPELLVGFATVLAISAGDLAALTGIDLGDRLMPASPASADVAGLIWDIRRLTADQMRQVCDAAKSNSLPKGAPENTDK